MRSANSFYIEVWTEHFLGTSQRCRAFLALLQALDGGVWVPQKWGHFEPVRQRYVAGEHASIIRAWTEERPQGSGWHRNSILFSKRDPRAAFEVHTRRDEVPQLNWTGLKLAAKPFESPTGRDRLIGIMAALVEWSEAAYAYIRPSTQLHKRAAGGTPLQRLQRMDWVTYFGPPYLKMFGLDRLKAAPADLVVPIDAGLLVRATLSPDDERITASSAFLVAIENYLGAEAFAPGGYLEKSCRVPAFDLSETIAARGSGSPP